MSVWSDTRQALDTRLSTASGLPDIAWANTTFKPTSGSAYIKPTILQGDSAVNTLAGEQTNIGIYSIGVFVQTENGSNDLLNLVDGLYDHFKSVNFITVNSTKVSINAISRTPSLREEDWFFCSLDISFESCA